MTPRTILALLSLGCPLVAQSPRPLTALDASLVQDARLGRGECVLRVRFAERIRERVVRITPPHGGAVWLRDDGLRPDRHAGDGVFNAVVRADFDAEARLFDGNAEKIIRRRQVPIYVGRELREHVPVEKLPLRRRADTVPMLPVGVSTTIDHDKSLFITHDTVIGDAMRTYNSCDDVGASGGIWTFGHLMTEICNEPVSGIPPQQFVRDWLDLWMMSQPVNSFDVAERIAMMDIINAWPSDANGLVLSEAPFRLLAIVNRVDLRENSFYGGGSAGELRFVFCLVDCVDEAARPFLVIFEYGVPIAGCSAVKAWGQSWADLSGLPFGPAYNTALAQLTTQVTERNLAPGKPNLSALNQLRTNENHLTGSFTGTWELREFQVATSGELFQSTNAMTPDQSYLTDPMKKANLIDYLASESAAPPIPLLLDPMFGGEALRGGTVQLFGPNHHWGNMGTLDGELRHQFSLNTCSGCHGGETANALGQPGFRHVNEAYFDDPPVLSKFLRGDGLGGPFTVTDPDDGVTQRDFFEFDRRCEDLDVLINQSCFSGILLQQLRGPH